MSELDCLECLSNRIRTNFDFRNYGHALEILTEAFPEEWSELQDALEAFSISVDELKKPGGMRAPSL